MIEKLKIVAIGNPFQFLGGGQRRTYEVLKHYPELGADVVLYIPPSQLVLTRALQEYFHINEKILYEDLEGLERCGVYVHESKSTYLEKMNEQVVKYLNVLRRGGIMWVLNNFKRLIPPNDRDAIMFCKNLLKNDETFMKMMSKARAVYVMDNFLDMIQAGRFLSQTIKVPLFVLLQSIPVSSLKNFVKNEWVNNVVLGGKSPLRTLFRIAIRTLEQGYFKYKTLFTYNNASETLVALLSVSEAPIKLSNLGVWASRNNIPIKILVPGNAVSQDIGEYYKERERILKMKEDYAIFYARLGVSKGILEIPLIAKKLEKAGYRLILMGRFDSVNVKRRFERMCRELSVKNIKLRRLFATR